MLQFSSNQDLPNAFQTTVLVLISALAFQLSNSIFRKIVTHYIKLPIKDAHTYFNTLTSLFHAMVVGIPNLICFLYFPDINANPVFTRNIWAFVIGSISTGYFLYDFFDIIKRGSLVIKFAVCMHHIFVGGGFYYILVNYVGIGYLTICLITEMNTIFLHARLVLKMSGLRPSHRLFRLNSWINFFSFIVFRGYALCNMTTRLYTEYHTHEPKNYFVMFSCVLGVDVINAIIFYQLIVKDFIMYYRHKKYQID